MLSASQRENLKDPDAAARDLQAAERRANTLQQHLTEANRRLEAQAAVLKMLVQAAGGEILVPAALSNSAKEIHERKILQSEWQGGGDLLYKVSDRKAAKPDEGTQQVLR